MLTVVHDKRQKVIEFGTVIVSHAMRKSYHYVTNVMYDVANRVNCRDGAIWPEHLEKYWMKAKRQTSLTFLRHGLGFSTTTLSLEGIGEQNGYSSPQNLTKTLKLLLLSRYKTSSVGNISHNLLSFFS